LFLNLRDKQSLAYTVTSSNIQGIETGYFGLYIATDPAKKQQAITSLFGEVDRLCQEKIPTFELARAKNYLIGNHAIDHQKNGAIAQQLATNTLYNMGLNEFFEYAKFINRITRDDVMRVARKYLKKDHCVVGIVGP
jgi:zinc protease